MHGFSRKHLEIPQGIHDSRERFVRGAGPSSDACSGPAQQKRCAFVFHRRGPADTHQVKRVRAVAGGTGAHPTGEKALRNRVPLAIGVALAGYF